MAQVPWHGVKVSFMELIVNVHLSVDSGDWTQVTRSAQQGPFPMQVVCVVVGKGDPK